MSDSIYSTRRARRLLSAEQKYEIWLKILAGEVTTNEAAAQAGVDRSTVLKLRKVAKDGAIAALQASRPGRRNSARRFRAGPAESRQRPVVGHGDRAGNRAGRVAGKSGLGLSGPIPVGSENSAVVVDLPRCGPMLSPRVTESRTDSWSQDGARNPLVSAHDRTMGTHTHTRAPTHGLRETR